MKFHIDITNLVIKIKSYEYHFMKNWPLMQRKQFLSGIFPNWIIIAWNGITICVQHILRNIHMLVLCFIFVINIGSSNRLLPDCTRPLPETMLTYHQWVSEKINWIWFKNMIPQPSITNGANGLKRLIDSCTLFFSYHSELLQWHWGNYLDEVAQHKG